MSTTYPPLNQSLSISKRSFFDYSLLIKILTAIDVRLQHLYGLEDALVDATDTVQGVALDRINEVLTPAIESVFRMAELGFLVAHSESEGTLGNGNILTLIIEDDDERELFTPSPFVALTRVANATDYGIAKKNSYDPETGELVCQVLSYAGSPGPHDDWVIGALAGSTIAQQLMLDQTIAAQEAIEEASEDAVTAAAESIAARDITVEAKDIAVDAKIDAVAAKEAAEAAAASIVDPVSETEFNDALAALISSGKYAGKNFVASGPITANNLVALRADGKVEVLTGTEAAATAGTAVNIAGAGTFVDAAYNATAGKIAVLYWNTTTYSIIIGTISGSAITFGTAVNLGAAGGNYGKVAWKSDGTAVAIAYATNAATTISMYVCSISGNTPTAGTVVTSAATMSAPYVHFLAWEATGGRLIIIFDTPVRMLACSVSGTTITAGTSSASALAATGVGTGYFTEASARAVFVSLAGDVLAGTVSTLTWTLGSVIALAFTTVSSAISAAGTLVVHAYKNISSTSFETHLVAITFSGATGTAGTAIVRDGNNALLPGIAYSVADDKFVAHLSTVETARYVQEGMTLWVATLSGNTITLSKVTEFKDCTRLRALGITSTGTIAIKCELLSRKGARVHISAKIVDGEVVVNTSAAAVTFTGTSAVTPSAWLMRTTTYIEIVSVTYAVVITAATFTGNAHRFIGQAKATVADAATVFVGIWGSIATGLSGLTLLADYWLTIAGVPTTTDTGRKLGRALSATELRIEK